MSLKKALTKTRKQIKKFESEGIVIGSDNLYRKRESQLVRRIEKNSIV